MEKFIEQYESFIINHPIINTVIISIFLALLFTLIKFSFGLTISRTKKSKADKMIQKRKLNQILGYMFFFTLLMLWFNQLQIFFVSIFAVAAAIVLAFKELIMCITGGLLVRLSHVFSEGQRIEIDDKRGFVIEKTLLTTKILELGPEKNSQQTTGEIITIPNSLMLSKSLKNESYFKGYSIKSFVFKLADVQKVEGFEVALLEKATALCSEYVESAKKGISKFCEKEGIVIPSVSPRTKILVEDGKDFLVLVKLPVKNDQIAEVEQHLNRFYLSWQLKDMASIK